MSAEPVKAYEVDRVSRCVVTLRVYAASAADARRRANEDGEQLSTEYFARGFGRPRRAPDYDRQAAGRFNGLSRVDA